MCLSYVLIRPVQRPPRKLPAAASGALPAQHCASHGGFAWCLQALKVRVEGLSRIVLTLPLSLSLSLSLTSLSLSLATRQPLQSAYATDPQGQDGTHGMNKEPLIWYLHRENLKKNKQKCKIRHGNIRSVSRTRSSTGFPV